METLTHERERGHVTTTIAAIDFGQGVEDAWSDVASFVPKFLGFLVILAVGYFLAKAISAIVDKALERVGFDRAVERGGIRQALAKSKYDASDLVSKVVFYGLFLLVLQMAFGLFGDNPVSDLIASVIAYLPKVFVAIVIVVVAAAIAAAVKEIVGSALGGLSYGRTLATAASVAILVIGAFAALNQLEIAPAIVNGLFYALLAIVAGSAIIAIGGGGIQPMRTRWEQTLARYDQEKPRVQQQMETAGGRVRQRAVEVRERAEAELGTTDDTTRMPTDPTPGMTTARPATRRTP
jgi:hypothetical protein